VADGVANEGRGANGRFAAGNPGGPGGSRRRAAVLRQAAEEAVTPEHIQALVRKALRLGLEGNLAAARLLLEYTIGRAAAAPVEAEPLQVQLPRIRSADDCNLAIQRVMDGICRGTIGRDDAALLIQAVQARLKAIELTDLERRLAELEKMATIVKGPRFLRGPHP
jgi:hypothetical protein